MVLTEENIVEMLSGAEMVIRSLQDEGVDYIYGYPGGSVPLVDTGSAAPLRAGSPVMQPVEGNTLMIMAELSYLDTFILGRHLLPAWRKMK